MHVGLAFDLQTDPADPHQAEYDPPQTIHALRCALEGLGHHVSLMGGAEELLAAGPSRWCDVDLVFNIAEGAHGRCREAWVPMLLERWGIPFVGSGAITQALALDKVMSKRLAQASGVRTPRWCVTEHAGALLGGQVPPFPVIVKPRYGGSGMGIDPGAVVRDAASLRDRLAWVAERFHQPSLIEAFVPFGELTVLLIGNAPPQALPAIQRPLEPQSRLACHVAGVSSSSAWLSPVELTPALDARAGQLAVTMFEALGCLDMARVDLRVDEHGELFFLEINPLPSCDPEGSVGLIAECLGTTYRVLIGQILNAALLRLRIRDRGWHSSEPLASERRHSTPRTPDT